MRRKPGSTSTGRGVIAVLVSLPRRAAILVVRVVVALLACVFAAPAVAQDCFAPSDSAQLDAALARAEQAWVADDTSAFRAAVQEASSFLVPCLGEPVAPPVAARLHRVLALQDFAALDKPLAFAEMRAARQVDPDAALPSALLPPGHELRRAYEQVPSPSAGHRVPTPRGTIWFDGTATRERPDRPTLAQIADPSGTIRTSTWLDADDPMPRYERPKIRPALAIAAGVAAGLAAGVAGASGGTWSAYHHTDPADANTLDRLRDATNGLAGAGVGLGAVALGTGLGAILVGNR